MNKETIKYFICYIIKRNLISTINLLEFRKICKQWKYIIENESSIINRLLTYKIEINKKLFYNKTNYDQYHYKRIIIKNILIPLFPQYQKIKIPFINSYYMDLDDMEIQDKVYFIGDENIPIEFSIFLQEYYNSPTVYIRIYPPNIIEKNIIEHKNKLRERIINMKIDKPDLYGIIFLVPLCYSKHYRSHYKDKQFINILCYINIIDKDLESDFPETYERYIVLNIELNDLENNELHYDTLFKYLMDISKSIISNDPQNKLKDYYYPQDLAYNAQSFEKCFDVLIQNQKFNL